MASGDLDEIIRRAETLTPEELSNLIAHLAQKARELSQAGGRRRQWSEIFGAASYPMVGEDAQQWVSRTRNEGDEHREDQRDRAS